MVSCVRASTKLICVCSLDLAFRASPLGSHLSVSPSCVVYGCLVHFLLWYAPYLYGFPVSPVVTAFVGSLSPAVRPTSCSCLLKASESPAGGEGDECRLVLLFTFIVSLSSPVVEVSLLPFLFLSFPRFPLLFPFHLQFSLSWVGIQPPPPPGQFLSIKTHSLRLRAVVLLHLSVREYP